jgi:hypothetical protein
MVGISDMNLNLIDGIGILSIITSAISESLKNLKKPWYPEMLSLLSPEDNEEILHTKSNELWLSWKKLCKSSGFKENIVHIFELSYSNFHYSFSIPSRNGEIKRYLGKHYAIKTGTRVGD